MEPDILTIVERIAASSPLVMVIFLVYAGYKQMWVWGWQYDKLVKDDRETIGKMEVEIANWKTLALDNLKMTARLADENDRLREENEGLRRLTQGSQQQTRMGSD